MFCPGNSEEGVGRLRCILPVKGSGVVNAWETDRNRNHEIIYERFYNQYFVK